MYIPEEVEMNNYFFNLLSYFLDYVAESCGSEHVLCRYVKFKLADDSWNKTND